MEIEDMNDNSICRGKKSRMGMEVQETCDIMTAAHDIHPRTEKIDEILVYGEHIANHLRGLQDKYSAPLVQNYFDKIMLRA
jgi:hypothetical protein